MGFLDGASNGSAIDPVSFMDSGIPEQIGKLVAMGLLVAVGSTRDRGAISLSLTHEGDREREYFRDSEEAQVWLEHAVAVLVAKGFGVNGQEPPATQTPTKRPSAARRGAKSP